MSIAEIATALRTTEKNAPTRIIRMKLGVVCSRCGGSGQYSFNSISGSTCFKCGGAGNLMPKTKLELAETLDDAKLAATDGRLDKYIATQHAIRATKGGLDKIFAAWKDMDTLNGYGKYRIGSGVPIDPDVKRRNMAGVNAVDAFQKAINKRTSEIDWIEVAAILEAGLKAIAAAKAELEA